MATPQLEPSLGVGHPQAAAGSAQRDATSGAIGRRLIRNTVANVVGQISIAALALFSTPYIVTGLGPANYGLLLFAFAYVEVFAFVDLGISAALVRELARSLSRLSVGEVNRYLGTALTIFAVGGTLIVFVLGATSFLVIVGFGNLPADAYPTLRVLVGVAGGSLLLRFLAQPFSAVGVAAQRFDAVNAIAIGSEAFRVIASVVVVAMGGSITAVAVVTLLTTAVTFGGHVSVARSIVPGLAPRPAFDRTHVRSIVHFSKYLVVATVSGRVTHSADKLMIGWFLPLASVAFYSVPYSLASRLRSLVGNVTTVVFPAASALAAGASRPALKDLYVRSSKMVAALAAFPAIVLTLFSWEILNAWMGRDFAQQGAVALAWASAGFLINCLAHIPSVVTQAVGRPQFAARFAVLNATLNSVALIILVPVLGIAGAGIAFFAAQAVGTPWYVHSANRLIGVSWRRLLVGAYLPLAPAVLAVGAVAWLGRLWVSSLGMLAVVVASAFVAYAVLLVRALDAKERAACRSLMAARSAARRPGTVPSA